MDVSFSANQTYALSRISSDKSVKQTMPSENTTKSDAPPEASLETIKKLGSLVLGKGNIERWEAEGLELDDAVYEKAYEAFNEAFKWGQSQGSGLSSISLSFNAHDIVASAQEVPSWFEAERAQYIDQHQHPAVREAFTDGDLWYGHINSVYV